jgi:hypothetical protein
LGKVDDFYFDGDSWSIRYIVVDTGGWITGRQVLIPRQAVEAVIPEKEQLSVNLTRQQVQDSPGIEQDPPVSRKYEADLHSYYGWPPYWGGGAGVGAFGVGGVGMGVGVGGVGVPPAIPGDASRRATEAPAETSEETRIRSTHEVTGYAIEASDGNIGHVEDFLISPDDWTIGYVIVDTRNWLPGGRKVLVSPWWVSDVDWLARKVVVDHTRESIKASPEFDPSQPFTDDYRERLHAHYGRPH